ncbi:DNA repair helicase, partial [Rozella allomycis CSF55]
KQSKECLGQFILCFFLVLYFIQFAPDEEIGGEDGMSCFADTDAFKNLRIDVLFDEGLASPTNTITVFYGERAPWWLKLTANGQMAHGSQFIINSAMANMRMIEESTIHGKSVGETPTCNITMLNGGYQTNIVPDVKTLKHLLRHGQSHTKFINKWMDGTTSPTDGPFFGCIDQTFKEMGIEYELDIFRGATDSRFVRRKGILAYNVSPMRNTPILLHDYNEFINEAVFFEGIDFYKILIPKIPIIYKVSVATQDAALYVLYFSGMPTYKIRGIDVDFPYEAYDCQLVFMEKVITSLQQREHALLESPTGNRKNYFVPGTGKTLCLLCATLAWRAHEFKNVMKDMGDRMPDGDSDEVRVRMPKIIFASRTHSHPKVTTLASRDHMCLHPDVQKVSTNTAKTAVCRKLARKGNCEFHKNMSACESKFKGTVMDIEEIASLSLENHACPYYLSRCDQDNSDFMVVPYNYLIDRDARTFQKVDVKDSIIIFDEAHNLENFCSESKSFELTSVDLGLAIDEMNILARAIKQYSNGKKSIEKDFFKKKKNNNEDQSIADEDISLMRSLLTTMERKLMDMPIQDTSKGRSESGSFIYTFFTQCGIDLQVATHLLPLVGNACEILEQSSLREFEEALKILYASATGTQVKHMENIQRYYRTHIQVTEQVTKKGMKGTKSLNLWEFGQVLENPHVIPPEQLYVGILTVGPKGIPLSSSYQNRTNSEYLLDLGDSLVNFCRIVPDGILVFFPSYSTMEAACNEWKKIKGSRQSVWSRMNQYKKIVIEPKDRNEFIEVKYYEAIDFKTSELTGAMYFGVCRGKISEGIDFSDAKARAVIITGIPYPPMLDPRITLKKNFMDEEVKKKANAMCLNGNEWYHQQASRAVNQAIGRVIRHKNDYGAVIL